MADIDSDHASPAEVSEPGARRSAARVSRDPHFSATLGTKIKAALVKAGMSQSDLGDVLGVAFRQVQKYENGANRVTADTLQVIGDMLGAHPGSFFDGYMPTPDEAVSDPRETIRTVVAIQQIRNPDTRRQLLALAEELARVETGGP